MMLTLLHVRQVTRRFALCRMRSLRLSAVATSQRQGELVAILDTRRMLQLRNDRRGEGVGSPLPQPRIANGEPESPPRRGRSGGWPTALQGPCLIRTKEEQFGKDFELTRGGKGGVTGRAP